MISLKEFMKVDLKVAKIEQASRVPNTSKLLKLMVFDGDKTRQIVAGIGDRYEPEELVEKKIILVANLEPAVIRGVESQGMLLAADVNQKATVIFVPEEVPAGAKVR